MTSSLPFPDDPSLLPLLRHLRENAEFQIGKFRVVTFAPGEDPEGKKRGVLSTGRFKPGEVVVRSPPLNLVVDPREKGMRCACCLATRRPGAPTPSSLTLLRCSRCKGIWYCSQSCQTLDWPRHKPLCSPSLLPLSQSQDFLLLFLLASDRIRASQSPSSSSSSSSSELTSLLLKCFQSLQSHVGELETKDPGVATGYSGLAEGVRQQLKKSFGEAAPLPSITELVEDLGRFGCNNFELHDSQLFPFGWGTFPVTSLFNHSCDPNLIIMMDKDHQVLRVIREVEQGEELCYSYIDVALSREERRKLLREKYFFECHCARCGSEEQSDREAAMERLLGNAASGALKLEPGIEVGELVRSAASTTRAEFVGRLLKGPSLAGPGAESREAKQMVQEADEALDAYRKGGPEGVPEREQVIALTKIRGDFLSALASPFSLMLVSVSSILMTKLIDRGEWAAAEEPCSHILVIYLVAYPWNHPLVGLQLLTLGKIQWNALKTQEAIETLSWALKVFKVTHGTKDEIYKETEGLLGDAKYELEALKGK